MARGAQSDAVFLTAVACLFGAIFAVRVGYGTTEDGLGLLYVVPISLVAVRLGIAAGLAAAALAFALLVLWVTIDDVDLSVLGFVTRGAAYVVSAGALGVLEQRMRVAQARRHALAMHDDIVQGLTVARYSFDHGRPEDGLAALDRTLEKARASVTAELGDAPEPGSLRR